MPAQQVLRAYAQVLLQRGINLQNKQLLVLSAPVEAHEFVAVITAEAYKAGASQVIMDWRCDPLTRLRYEQEELSRFTEFPSWKRDFYLHYYHKKAAFINLISANPSLLQGISSEKITAWQHARHNALQEYISGMMASQVPWLIAAVPGKEWAQLLFPAAGTKAIELLWQKILSAARANGENPLADWDRHLLQLERRRRWLTAHHFVSLHYKNARGTDLQIGLPEHHIWQGGQEETAYGHFFNANIPTEEVYTAPRADQVNGTVYNTKPLVYNGNIIDQFSLTFQAGKVVAADAEIGNELLQTILQMDENACRLGEVALVPYHSPISLSHTLFYETLLDENASCHLALGAAYPTCIQNGSAMTKEELQQAHINDSVIHVDFMIGSEDLQITGRTADNKEIPIFTNGDWSASDPQS